jgi:hypothetical protein
MAFVFVLGCAATAPPPAAHVRRPTPANGLIIAETVPPEGKDILAGTVVRAVVAYAFDQVKPGNDRLSLVFKTRGGKTWEPRQVDLIQSRGEVTFELPADEVLQQTSLVRPFQMLAVRDRGPGVDRAAQASATVFFYAARTPDGKHSGSLHLLPPNVGKGQLAMDPFQDPDHRPPLPPGFKGTGPVWGLYKICVDDEGDVFHISALKSAGSAVDLRWLQIVRRWKHRPYTVDGTAVPFAYPLRIEVRPGS